MKLSVCLATYNEEANIGRCLESVKEIADEIIVVDGTSTDSTADIAKKHGAKVVVTQNEKIFQINKQKALDGAKGDWVLLMDADEEVTPALRDEIKKIMEMNPKEVEKYQESLTNRKLFLRHQEILAKRDGVIGTQSGNYNAFFIPRLNYFLGKYIRYGGVYPDGVIRLFRNGKARLPATDVHEQMVVEGRVGWLQNDLYHYDSPTFSRYIARNNRYINLIRDEFKRDSVGKDPFTLLRYMVAKPVSWFFMTQLRHKGILDGYQGVIFSFFSALRFPRAYWRYLRS